MSIGVLIFDGDVKLAKLYGRFLCDHGFRAEIAASEFECQERLQERAWGSLVLDCEIPKRGAHRLLAWSRTTCVAMPVILTTWRGSPESVRRHVVPPVVQCLRKFFPLPALADAIRMAARSGGAQDGVAECFELVRR
jgi:DNA-binding NtrC family response regulator